MAITETVHSEEEFTFDKSMTCVSCGEPFKTKILKSSKARRIGSDADLRPRYAHIDTLKYGVCSCPNCGYSALHSTFSNVIGRQIENIKQEVCVRFMPEDRSGWKSYSYDQAIRLHELALKCSEAKPAKDGEKAYLHLLLAWLIREKGEQADEIADEAIREAERESCKKQADEHYLKAFEGFEKAMMNELFPIMGLNQPTLEYMLAYMAFYFGKTEVAAKLLGSVLTNKSASRHIKDNALDLKDEIIGQLRQKKQA